MTNDSAPRTPGPLHTGEIQTPDQKGVPLLHSGEGIVVWVYGGPRWRADAEFLERAWNTHDDLVAALEGYRGAFERIQQMQGWKEGEADLWAAPELGQADILACAVLIEAKEKGAT